jgi:hypothetical protein
MLILPIIVKPQAKEQHKATPQIKKKKYIYIESDHWQAMWKNSRTAQVKSQTRMSVSRRLQ